MNTQSCDWCHSWGHVTHQEVPFDAGKSDSRQEVRDGESQEEVGIMVDMLDLSTACEISLTLFGLGAILDFLISKYRKSLWKKSRQFWRRIEKIRFRSVHRKVAIALVKIPVRTLQKISKDSPEGLYKVVIPVAVLALSLAWATIGANLIAVFCPDDAPVKMIATALNLFFLPPVTYFISYFIYAFLWGFIGDWTKREEVHQGFRNYFELIFFFNPASSGGCFLSFCGLIGTIWYFLTFQITREVGGLVFLLCVLNYGFDLLSAKITFEFVKKVIFGKKIWGLLAPVLDIASAFAIKFSANFLFKIVLIQFFFAHNFSFKNDPFYGIFTFLNWMTFSILLPTGIIAFTILFTYLLKIFLILIRWFLLEFIDRVADPKDKTKQVRPFTALGATAGIFVFFIYVGQKIVSGVL